jgi:2-acylglycerol O-acyltransferase 2
MIIFKGMRNFLQMEIACPLPNELIEAEQKPNAQFVFACFPHACFSDYRVSMDGILDQALPHVWKNTRTLAATVLFRLPICREIALWTGAIDARRSVAEALLDRGRSFIVLPGGEAEQIRTVHGKERVYLKSRKGFIKLALRKGVPVVPVYIFGASDYYYTSNMFFGPREWLQKTFGVCIPLAIGRWGSLICPLPVKTTLTFAKPMSFTVKVRGAPTDEEVDKAHAAFCTALKELFDDHKAGLGYGNRNLEFL